MNIETILAEINKRSQGKPLFLLAIDGRSGSGKTTLAQQLQQALPSSSIIHVDQFDLYAGPANIQKVAKEILEPIKEGIIIVEGIFALSQELLSFYDYKIWIDCSADVGFERGLKRDIQNNGIDNSEKWKTYWLPKEEEYIQKENPQQKADHIINI